MSRIPRWMLAAMLLAPLPGLAQSQRQLADRHVAGSVVRTTDARKGEPTVRIVITRYDRRGNATELIERDEQGRLLRWEKHTYDRRGRELLAAVLDSAGVELERLETTRDRWGNETATCQWRKGTVTERTTTRYDANGDKMEELVLDAADRLVRRTTFAYEGRGLIQRRTVLDADGKVVYDRSYEYTY